MNSSFIASGQGYAPFQEFSESYCGTRPLVKFFPPCVASDNKAFFVISMSENGAHIYELVAQTVSEKNV